MQVVGAGRDGGETVYSTARILIPSGRLRVSWSSSVDKGMMNDGPTRQPNSGPDWEALARFSAGECSPEEAAAIRRWLDANPRDAAVVAALNDASSKLAFATARDLDVERALRRVKARFDKSDDQLLERLRATGRTLPPSRRGTLYTVLGLAAAAGIVALVVSRTPDRATKIIADPPPPRVYTTAVGQRDSVVLADGSRVILGPSTELQVGDFNRERLVALKGTAHFDVVHDAAKPFSVRDGNAVVTDLGTAFSVEDDVDGTVHIAVTAGSVELRGASANSSVTLQARDRGILDPNGTARAVRGDVKDDDLAWMQGRLVFRDAPLPHVAAELRRWYGLVLVADSSIRGPVTNTALPGDSGRHIVDVIALTLGARVEQKGDTVYLHAARPRAAPQ
jgi:transmembrane sensor